MSKWGGVEVRRSGRKERWELNEGAEQACGVFNHNFSSAGCMFVAYLIIHPKATDPLN